MKSTKAKRNLVDRYLREQWMKNQLRSSCHHSEAMSFMSEIGGTIFSVTIVLFCSFVASSSCTAVDTPPGRIAVQKNEVSAKSLLFSPPFSVSPLKILYT